jgi:Kef-type K+ transport system membrane component KefB
MFQIAGWINLALGLYVLIQGPGFLPQSTVFWLTLFFFAFAAVDFWIPRMLRKRWQQMLEKHMAEQQAGKKP